MFLMERPYILEKKSVLFMKNVRTFCVKILLSGKNKLKALYLFIHRCCSRFTYPGAWFSVSNCKHYKMCLF